MQRGRKNRGGLLLFSGLGGGPTGPHPSRLERARAVARTLTLLLAPAKMAFILWYGSLVTIVRASCFRGAKGNLLARRCKWFGVETQRWARSGLSSDNKRGGSILGAASPGTRRPCRLQKLEPLLRGRALGWLSNLCIHSQREGIGGTPVGFTPRRPLGYQDALRCSIAVVVIIVTLLMGRRIFDHIYPHARRRISTCRAKWGRAFPFPISRPPISLLCNRRPDHTPAGLPCLVRIRTDRLKRT